MGNSKMMPLYDIMDQDKGTAALPKAHLTLLSQIFGSGWLTTPSQQSSSFGSFLYSSFVYRSHLFLISSASQVSTVYVLYCTHLWTKCSLDSSNFPEEISSLSPSVVFFQFYTLFTEEGLLVSLCCSLEICVQLNILFPFSLTFCFSSFLSYL